jgi:transcriptional regulator with XRE-family HTH domain
MGGNWAAMTGYAAHGGKLRHGNSIVKRKLPLSNFFGDARVFMSVEFAEIRKLLKSRGMKLADAANVMGIDAPKLSKTLKGKRRAQFPELSRLAHALKVPTHEVLTLFGIDFDYTEEVRTVTGYIDDQETVVLNSDQFQSFRFLAPFNGYDGVVVVVKSHVFAPRYLEGEVLAFYPQNFLPKHNDTDYTLDRAVGCEVIACLADGTLMLRRLQKGTQPGRYSLISLNPQRPPLIDVELSWASAIDWHIPDLVVPPD